MDLQTIKTPSLVLDVERVRRNAERMSARVTRARRVALRPHVKTHKCVEVARIQTAGHAGGITVSTLAEARAFAAHGFTDITYAVPIEPGKFDEAIELSRALRTLRAHHGRRPDPARCSTRPRGARASRSTSF